MTGKSVAEATAFANGLHIPARAPGKIAAPSKPADAQTADPDPVQDNSGGNLDNPRGEPVEIPADWNAPGTHWTSHVKLAQAIVGGERLLVAEEGQTVAQKARAIIEAEVAERAAKG